MSEQRQIEEAAKLDGRTIGDDVWNQEGKWWTAITGNIGRLPIPDYLHDYNAVHRLIAGMDYRQATAYHTALADITGCCVIGFIKATCAQMLEAVLRAYGVWEED